jgi:hypothetical protein
MVDRGGLDPDCSGYAPHGCFCISVSQEKVGGLIQDTRSHRFLIRRLRADWSFSDV